jgi:hypothetical protein
MQFHPQHFAILELELELLSVEVGIVLVDDVVVIWTYDNDVRRVVVL